MSAPDRGGTAGAARRRVRRHRRGHRVPRRQTRAAAYLLGRWAGGDEPRRGAGRRRNSGGEPVHAAGLDLGKGNRPSYIKAAPEAVSRPLYERFTARVAELLGRGVATGEFGADMQVELVNDGPVTIWMDSKTKITYLYQNEENFLHFCFWALPWPSPPAGMKRRRPERTGS